jgi:hypothetical protein
MIREYTESSAAPDTKSQAARMPWTAPKWSRVPVENAEHGPGPSPDSAPIDS